MHWKFRVIESKENCSVIRKFGMSQTFKAFITWEDYEEKIHCIVVLTENSA